MFLDYVVVSIVTSALMNGDCFLHINITVYIILVTPHVCFRVDVRGLLNSITSVLSQNPIVGMHISFVERFFFSLYGEYPQGASEPEQISVLII